LLPAVFASSLKSITVLALRPNEDYSRDYSGLAVTFVTLVTLILF